MPIETIKKASGAMDTLRGYFDKSEYEGDDRDDDVGDEDIGLDPPHSPVGEDERRMQMRAYNYWASLLGNRNYPLIEDLDPENSPDFGPYSVLLDFSLGLENPLIPFLGQMLGSECGVDEPIGHLSEAPCRSLLSRICEHYQQILANRAPIGFEAECFNQRGRPIVYRGILLPFSSDGNAIDFIYGVINWKEVPDQLTADELLLEIDRAVDGHIHAADEAEQNENPGHAVQSRFGSLAPIGDDEGEYYDSDEGEDDEDYEGEAHYASLLSSMGNDKARAADVDPAPEDFEGASAQIQAANDHSHAPQEASLPRPAKKPIDLSAYSPDPDAPAEQDARNGPVESLPSGEGASRSDLPQELVLATTSPTGRATGLDGMLAAARELALAARSSEDRSRATLYEAVGRAYDVSIEAAEMPSEFEDLVARHGLTVQDRAPMTPIVKLVFGTDYDKTRITEYAAVLAHAHRIGIERGRLSAFLSETEGGLKGVVQAERRLRREESGRTPQLAEAVRETLARKLRELDTKPLNAIDGEGAEFALVMIRRLETGEVVVLGEIADDIPLLEKAARKLVE